MMVSAAFLALAALSGAAPAATQSAAAVSAVQPLDFGELLPGIPEKVTVDDAWRRAEVSLVASGNLTIRVVVPAALVSRDGSTIPLSFRFGDGAVMHRNGRIATFDPNQPVRVRIPPGHGAASVLVGSTANASSTQPAGVYTATMVVVVSPTDT
jgi:hypothetical protein